MDVVFKVALVLLGNHKELIKQCNSFETVMEFLKTTLPSMGIIQMERIINQVNIVRKKKLGEEYCKGKALFPLIKSSFPL